MLSLRSLITGAVLLLASLMPGCSTDDLGSKIAQLDSERREQVIDELLAAVKRAPKKQRERIRERVVFALMEAYREDVRRGQIVAALALLRDPRAEEVFVAAIKDAKRAGPYLEAALRAARMLGELRLQSAVPHLIAVLKEAQQGKPSEQSNLLKRALIEALRQLGDLRAVPSLVAVLRAEPLSQDMALTKLAVRALGDLRAVAAVPALVELLGGSHGMLLFETTRRALCRVGEPAIAALNKAVEGDKHQRRSTAAVGAVQVLADLWPEATIDPLPGDPAAFTLAAAEASLRWRQDATAESRVIALLVEEQRALTDRRRAAAMLGWYGSERARAELARLIAGSELARPLLWAAMLAQARLAGGPAAPNLTVPSRIDALDKPTIGAYRERLSIINDCLGKQGQRDDEVACLLQAVEVKQEAATATDESQADGNGQQPTDGGPTPTMGASADARAANWRLAERAALELGRLGARGEPAPVLAGQISLSMARALAGEPPVAAAEKKRRAAAAPLELHPQVARAILISLERIERTLSEEVVQRVAAIIDQGLQSRRIRGDNRSRARCMVERLRRARGTKEESR